MPKSLVIVAGKGIAPGASEAIFVPRDPEHGFTVVREVRRGLLGAASGWSRRTDRLVAAPQPLVRLSVYELMVQSIARDSTRRGAGRIDEVSYAPRSVGMIVLPPGEQLRAGERIDVWTTAKMAGNAGIRRTIM